MPHVVGPFRSLESMLDVALSVVTSALDLNRWALDEGAYLLWNGSRFVGEPIIPENYGEYPTDGAILWYSEAEVVLQQVATMGLSGFVYAFRKDSRMEWYILCFNSKGRSIFTAAKIRYDRDADTMKMCNLTEKDWVFLHQKYLFHHSPTLVQVECRSYA